MTPFIIIETTGLPGSEYLGMITFPSMILASLHKTLTIVGSFFFRPGFFKQDSLRALLYIGISLMAWKRGIFIETCLS